MKSIWTSKLFMCKQHQGTLLMKVCPWDTDAISRVPWQVLFAAPPAAVARLPGRFKACAASCGERCTLDQLMSWWVTYGYGYMIFYMHDICIIGLRGFGLVSLFFHIILSCARKSSCSNSIVCCCVAVEVSLLCRCVPELCVGWRNAKQVMMTLWEAWVIG